LFTSKKWVEERVTIRQRGMVVISYKKCYVISTFIYIIPVGRRTFF